MSVFPRLDLKRIGESMSAAMLGSFARGSASAPIEASRLDEALDRVIATSATPSAAPASPRSVWSTQASQAPHARRAIRQSGLWRTARVAPVDASFDEALPALRGYLALLLRSYARAEEALEALRASARSSSRPDEDALTRWLVEARALASRDASASLGSEHAPWDAAPVGRPLGYGALLEELRALLSARELELLFLSRTLALPPAVVASVLEVEPAAVGEARASSQAWIALQLGDQPKFRGIAIESWLDDALRLEPPPDPLRLDAELPPPLPPGATLADRYVVERTVGGGAFGHVYRARDRRVPTHVVALKLAHRPSRTTASKEGALAELARIASAFHPSLVQLKEHGWHEDRLWFAMPFYEGETLEERIARAPLSPTEAAALLAPIAEALAALHRAGIRHQDVKPENILLAKLDDERTLPVLLDLGVGTSSDDQSVAGTPAFFAPELARRLIHPDEDVAVDDRSDVFALALTFARCVAPSAHDEEPDMDGFLAARAEAAPRFDEPALRGLRPRLARWASADARSRPSAAALAQELAALACVAPTDRRFPRALARLGIACALVLLGLALGLAVASWRQPTEPRASTPIGAPPSLVERARLAGLEERVEAAEERARALEGRAVRCVDPSASR